MQIRSSFARCIPRFLTPDLPECKICIDYANDQYTCQAGYAPV